MINSKLSSRSQESARCSEAKMQLSEGSGAKVALVAFPEVGFHVAS